MSNLSLPSRLTNSHIAPRIKITVAQHRQEFSHIWRMLQLIVLAPLLSGLMMPLSLAHINITSQTFRVSRLPGRFMSGLSPNFITCVTRTRKTLLNGPTLHGRNTRLTFFKPKYYAHVHGRVLCNAECAANVVVDDDHHSLFLYIMEYLHLVCL
jgi:hypothetical protein